MYKKCEFTVKPKTEYMTGNEKSTYLQITLSFNVRLCMCVCLFVCDEIDEWPLIQTSWAQFWTSTF